MVIGNNGVWDGFYNVIVYKISYFLLFGSTESVLVFLQQLLNDLDVFHGGEVHIVRRYVIKVSGIRWMVTSSELMVPEWVVVFVRKITSAMSILVLD